jgi:hypothetical protein
MGKWNVEYTDTFAGEANYSWVKREVIEIPNSADIRTPRARIMKAAKKAVGISGLRGRVSDYGDGFEFRPYRMLTVMFVSWHDCGGTCEQCRDE